MWYRNYTLPTLYRLGQGHNEFAAHGYVAIVLEYLGGRNLKLRRQPKWLSTDDRVPGWRLQSAYRAHEVAMYAMALESV